MGLTEGNSKAVTVRLPNEVVERLEKEAGELSLGEYLRDRLKLPVEKGGLTLKLYPALEDWLVVRAKERGCKDAAEYVLRSLEKAANLKSSLEASSL